MQQFSSRYNLQREHKGAMNYSKDWKKIWRNRKEECGLSGREAGKGVPDKKLYLRRDCMGDLDSATK